MPQTTFGIIGYGHFGRLWARCLVPFGNVLVFDAASVTVESPATLTSLQDVVSADMLFILVPIEVFKDCCKQIAPMLAPRTIVVDACSVKEHPVRVMQDVLPKTQPIIATHPLFGPQSVAQSGLKNKKVIVHPVRATPEQLEQLLQILHTMELQIIQATPEEHDYKMARSQALVHFIGRGFERLHLVPQEIATPDYETLLRMQTLVENNTWQLFMNMQNYNRFAKTTRDAFVHALQDVEKLIQE